MTWREARRLEHGLTGGEPGGIQWEEREVEEMCKQLGKTWGTLHDSKVELFLRALQRWGRRLKERAVGEWSLEPRSRKPTSEPRQGAPERPACTPLRRPIRTDTRAPTSAPGSVAGWPPSWHKTERRQTKSPEE